MKSRNVSIIGVPCDYGQQRRGVDMGPSAIRYAGVEERLTALGLTVQDEGDIRIEDMVTHANQQTNLLNLQETIEVSTALAEKVSSVVEKGQLPLVLGGDHSIAIGTIAGLSGHYENLGVIWFDAHADLNTPETTPSGNIHGMPLAACLG